MPGDTINCISDFHVGAANRKAVAERMREILLRNTDNIPPYTGDQINFKEEKTMMKRDLDLLIEENYQYEVMQLKMKPYSDRGFEVTITRKGEEKKEFVEYGEDVGEHINSLIHDFIEDIHDEQRQQDEIEWLENEIEHDKKQLAELKNK